MSDRKLETTCNAIRESWQQRQDLVGEHGSVVRRLKSICRRKCKGDKVEGTKLFESLRKGKADPLTLGACVVLLQAHDGIAEARKQQEKQLYSLVRSLPAWEWVETIRGASENALATVVGEAGDLNNYGGPAKLWKRMGMGLVSHKGETVRQRKAKDKKLAELMGYAPKRRAAMYVIGGNIIKARKGATGIAAELLGYYESEKAKALAKGLTKAHSHHRAQRHMEKMFLKLLWREWTGRGKEWVEPIPLKKAA